jgi:uncharacterized protein involved in exopolysaccharide biosynthesis
MEVKTMQLLVRRWWIVLLVFAVAFGLTAWLVSARKPVFETTTTLIVRPGASFEDARSLVSGLEILSRRAEIASTYAEVAASRLVRQRAAEQLGLTPEQRQDLRVDAQLLAGTNVLRITVSSSSQILARDFADQVGVETTAFVEELYEAYELTPLDRAPLPTQPAGMGTSPLLALGAVAGLILGGGAALLSGQLELARRAPQPVKVPDDSGNEQWQTSRSQGSVPG